MNSTGKLLLGIATCIPILGMGFLISHMFSLFFTTFSNIQTTYTPDPFLFYEEYFYLIGIVGLIGVLSFILMVFYIIHIVNNKKLSNTLQVIWILIILFFNSIGSIIYWYMNIWKAQETSFKPYANH